MDIKWAKDGRTGELFIVQARPDTLPDTRTQGMLNVGNPALAFGLSALPNQGVGLARMELIIANHIQVHPRALVKSSGPTEILGYKAYTCVVIN